jgi:hypothetical protein
VDVHAVQVGEAAAGSAVALRRWWRRGQSVLDELRVTGVVLVLFLAGYIVPSTVADALTDPLLEYHENGQRVQVQTGDGCLTYRKDTSSRRELVLSYCPARIPDGGDGWAPQLGDFYTVDAASRTVTELVLFGIVPEQVVRVRATLPGGHPVETATRRVADIRHPVVLLHLRNVALPVDLTETEGRRVFVGLTLFDAAGREVPVV